MHFKTDFFRIVLYREKTCKDSTESSDIAPKFNFFYYSVQFSCSVVSDPLWPCGPQHARPPCPSPPPGLRSNSCPSSPWCHPAISSSVVPFSSCLQSSIISIVYLMACLLSLLTQYRYILINLSLCSIQVSSVFTSCTFPVSGSHPESHIIFTCHVSLGSSGLWQLLRVLLFFDDLNASQIILFNSPLLEFFCCCSHDYTGDMHFGEEAHRDNFLFLSRQEYIL